MQKKLSQSDGDILYPFANEEIWFQRSRDYQHSFPWTLRSKIRVERAGTDSDFCSRVWCLSWVICICSTEAHHSTVRRLFAWVRKHTQTLSTWRRPWSSLLVDYIYNDFQSYTNHKSFMIITSVSVATIEGEWLSCWCGVSGSGRALSAWPLNFYHTPSIGATVVEVVSMWKVVDCVEVDFWCLVKISWGWCCFGCVLATLSFRSIEYVKCTLQTTPLQQTWLWFYLAS